MSTQVNKPALPPPVAVARVRRSAVLISVLLHAGLLTAIVTMRANSPATSDAMTTLRISVFPEFANEAAIDSLQDDDAFGDDGDNDAPESRAEEDEPARAGGAEPPPPGEQRLGEGQGESLVEFSAATPTDTPQEPIDEPPADGGAEEGLVAEATPANDPESIANETSADTAQETVAVRTGLGNDTAIEVPDTQRTEAIGDAESELLTRRVERWARSFAALADWQPESTWEDRGQEYSATVERVTPSGSMGVEHAIVTITTERDGVQLSTELRMQRLGFSHFAQFIDQWNPEVQIHDDVIDGRFHSNTEIFISRSGGIQPQFTGLVTAPRGVNTSLSRQRVRRDEVFAGGLDTRGGRITMPRRFTLFEDTDTADTEHVTRFATDSRIAFDADGSYRWTAIETSRRYKNSASDSPLSGGEGRLGAQPHYFVAGEDAELYVSGTVNGQVLVYSPEDIVIEGDLKYATDPVTDPSSDDYLGLVSDRSIEIAELSVTGRGDLHVQAAIYARRRFAVRDYSRSDNATLHVYGSVTAGSLTATEPRFSTQLRFDKRLEAARPPRFPMTDRYEVEAWDGDWIVSGD